MMRLRCGVILTRAFLDFLSEMWTREAPAHPRCVVVIDYVRCKDGPRAGQAWLECFWFAKAALSEHCVFTVAGAELYLSPQSQAGLKWRYLDAADGRLRVG